mgnify:CR=1 FL=1
MLPPSRVLIADDDREVRTGMVDLLQTLGLEVLEAESGPEALAVVRRELHLAPLHLLVLDFHMPGCSGLEVYTNLREEIFVPCIFYSGNPTREIERRALEAGAAAFLHKPVQPDLFRSHVLEVLGGGPAPN